MRISQAVFVGAIAVLTAFAAACSDSPTQFTELQPLPPDTGNLGLAHVAGFQAFTLVPDSTIQDSALKAYLVRRRAEPTTAAARVIRFADGIDSVLALGKALAFDVSPTRRLVFVVDEVSSLSNGYIRWKGKLQGGLPGGVSGDMTLGVTDGKITSGSVSVGVPWTEYSIRSLGNGLHLLVYVDYRKYPLD